MKIKNLILIIAIITVITLFIEIKEFSIIEAFAQSEKANIDKIEKALTEGEER